MILPSSEVAVIAVLALSLLCWVLWIGTHRVSKWRFELYYYDFTWGVVFAAVAFAFTLGSWDQSELTFQDNFLLTGYRKMAWAMAAGGVGNLGSILLLAASTVTRISVAFPVAFGTALAVRAVWFYFNTLDVNALLLFGGAGMVVVAAVLAGMAYSWNLDEQVDAAIRAMKADAHLKSAAFPKKPRISSGFFLAVLSGVFLALYYISMINATSEENGLFGYGAMLLASAGVFGSTILYVLFFINFPVKGKPLSIAQYFRGTLRQHLFGLLGGLCWTIAVLTPLVIGDMDAVPVGQTLLAYLTQAMPVLGMLAGLLVAREASGAGIRVQAMNAASLVIMLAGIGVIAAA